MKKMLLVLPLSLALFCVSTAHASIRDSKGRLRTGVYRVATGSPYISHLTLEIFRDHAFRMQLAPREEMKIKQNLLLEGRIVEDRSVPRDFGLQYFNLQTHRVWQVEPDSKLTEKNLIITDAIDIALAVTTLTRAYGLVTYDTALIDITAGSNHPGEFVIFLTELPLLQRFRKEDPNTYTRFNEALAPREKNCRTFFSPVR